jgi:hypothetical protein
MNTEDNKILLWSWLHRIYTDHNLISKPHSYAGVDDELGLERGTTLALLPEVLTEFNSRRKGGGFGNREIVFMGEKLFVFGDPVVPAPLIVAEKTDTKKK